MAESVKLCAWFSSSVEIELLGMLTTEGQNLISSSPQPKDNHVACWSMPKTPNILLTQSTKYVYIKKIYIIWLLRGCFLANITMWVMWMSFTHSVWVCFAVDSVALGHVWESHEVCCTWTVQGNIWSLEYAWGSPSSIRKFVNNLHYPYPSRCPSPSIPAPVILLSPNPTSSQINRQGGH